MNTTENMITEIITEINRNKNIEMIAETLVFSEYHAEYYRNNSNNKISYIVIHDDGNVEYIDCLLLNINIFDYYNGTDYKNNFSMDYLKEFGLFHHNGFLGVAYDVDHIKNNINDFFEKYGNCFIDDYKEYNSHNSENLKNRVIKLYDEITKEVNLLAKLDLLFW